MAEVSLNWAQASVDGGVLTVPLEGEVPDGWAQHFETTVKLLGTRQRGQVALEDQGVQVEGVSPGGEDDVRFYLEGVVEQANSAHRADQEQEEGHKDEDAHDREDEQEPQGEDAEMTERFREFAEEPADEEEKDEEDKG
jgi:hypothetical protein